MLNFFGNPLVWLDTLRFPRTPFGANIWARPCFWLWVWAVTFSKYRHGFVTSFVTVVSQLYQRFNPARDAVTVENPSPVCAGVCPCAPVCARMGKCVSRRHGVTATFLPFLITHKKKGLSVGEIAGLLVTFTVTFSREIRDFVTVGRLASSNPLKNNRIGGF